MLELSPGALLELGRRHDAPLELRLGPSRLGQGRAVDMEERLGFLVDEVDAAAPGNLSAPPS
jgi:flagellar motor switch/type III secretory pathway protein FliN